MAGTQAWVPRLWDGSFNSTLASIPAKTTARKQGSRPILPPLNCALIEPGGVLFDDTCWERWLLQLLSQIGIRTQFDTFYRVWELEYLPAVWRGHCNFWDALRHLLRSCGLAGAQCDEVLMTSMARRERMDCRCRAFPGVAITLNRLVASGLRLIAVFNSPLPISEISAKLDAIGLGRCFNSVYSSFDMGETIGSQAFINSVQAENVLSPGSTALLSNKSDNLRFGDTHGLISIGINQHRNGVAKYEFSQLQQLPSLISKPTTQRMAA